ncbi:MAG: hypothetical protein AB8U82_02470 [Rickettsia endosymbiont of Haemaphysalis japonica]
MLQDVLSQQQHKHSSKWRCKLWWSSCSSSCCCFCGSCCTIGFTGDPEEDAEEVIAVPAVAAPLAPAPVVINMEDVGVVLLPVEEAPHTGAEIMIVQRIERIVPVEGNIEGFDDDEDDDFNIEEDYENDDYNIIQERTKVEVSSSTNKSESKDPEVSLENLKQEEARQEEEAKVVAYIKEAAEASIAEAVRVEAAEVVEMQNAAKQD